MIDFTGDGWFQTAARQRFTMKSEVQSIRAIEPYLVVNLPVVFEKTRSQREADGIRSGKGKNLVKCIFNRMSIEKMGIPTQ